MADVGRLEQLRFWQDGQQTRGELRLWEHAIAGRPDQQHGTADLVQALGWRADDGCEQPREDCATGECSQPVGGSLGGAKFLA